MSLKLAALAAAAILLMPNLVGAQLLVQRDVSLRMALTIAQTAMAECGVNASVAVVDYAGRVRVLLQGDKSSPQTGTCPYAGLYGAQFRKPSSAGLMRRKRPPARAARE